MDVTDTAVNASMLSIQRLLNAVKGSVGLRYHNKVDNLFEFLKTHPSMFSYTDFTEAIIDGMQLPGSNVHNMLVFANREMNYLSNHHHKVWKS